MRSSAIDVVLPKLGMNMQEGTLSRWLVPDGAEVHRGQPIYELVTEKIECEVEAEADGVLTQVAAPESTLPPGAVVGRLDPVEGAPPRTPQSPSLMERAAMKWSKPDEVVIDAVPVDDRWVSASWAARRAAERTGLQLSSIRGTGPGGRILESDVSIALVLRPGLSSESRTVIENASAEPAPAGVAWREPTVPATGDVEEDIPEESAVRASPLARRLAERAGLALAGIEGTGPMGRIQVGDVEGEVAKADGESRRAVREEERGAADARVERPAPGRPLTLWGGPDQEASGIRPESDDLWRTPREVPVAEPPADGARAQPAGAGDTATEAAESIPYSGMRRVIGERLTESLQRMAQLTISTEVDVTEADRLRSQLAGEWSAQGIKPTYTDIVLKAVARGLVGHPLLNSSLGDDAITLHPHVHLGVAVAMDRGLIVPIVRNADIKSLKAISREASDLARRARAGELTVDDVTGGTFTVTSLGASGVDVFTPIVNPPQCAILGVGRARDLPRFDGDSVVKRTVMTLSLSFDHRIVDGVPAAALLARVREIIERPYLLLADD
ncbi:MAG: hypothetical protein GEU28_04720 [Dehalococcoidia bacterium]|nr:hypothetical protein [Dehalococcoidia bacterium]